MNPLKARLQANKPALGLLVSIPSAQLVAVAAETGIDWVFIDMEHSPINISAAQTMIMATKGTRCTPVVRVPEIRPEVVKPILDAGAFGIIFPMLNTAEEARLAVASTRYPPAGVRGIGPFHAAVRWGLTMPEYIKQANEHILTVGLIEDIKAVENIEAILETPGLDVAHLAPFDLSASLGVPGQLEHPDVLKAIARVEKAVLAQTRVKLGGLATTPPKAVELISKGYLNIIIGFDVGWLQSAAAQYMDLIKR